MTSQKQKHQYSHHHPVLLEKTLRLLSPREGESYLDLTAGYGGHAKEVFKHTKAPKKAVLVDRDASATAALKQLFGSDPEILQEAYLNVLVELHKTKRTFDIILMDLGTSSVQFDEAGRGFSIKADGPLDMRMDQRSQLTAQEIIDNWPEEKLAELIKIYGEEPRAKLVAKAIKQAQPKSTTQLAEIISKNIYSRGKIHPATRTFQALRIAVNDEIGQLEGALAYLPDLLNTGGRLAIISFHSLEDRLVKRFLREESRSGYESRLKLLNNRPIKGEIEKVYNPRSRSARLRAAVKINTHQK